MIYNDDITPNDRSMSVLYTVEINTENSRMTPRERVAARDIVRRHVAALNVQLTMLLSDRLEMGLERRSSANGILKMDISAGAANE